MSGSSGSKSRLYDGAKRLVVQHNYGSISFVQRHMKLSYSEAKQIVDDLTSEGVLTAPTKAGLRLLRPPHASAREFQASSQDKHVRLLRDMAIYLLECSEYNVGPDTRCTAMMLLPLKAKAGAMRAATAKIDRRQTPVFSTALALAGMPELSATFSPSDIQDALRVECAPFESRPVVDPSDREARLTLGFVQLARYLEKRLVDGGGAHTRAFECFVPDSLLPQGQSHAGGGYREHVVPCALLRDKCMELLRSGLPVEQVAEWMRPYLAIVVITPDEATKMDSEMGLKTRMPSGWRFDEDCIFDRLHVAGIEFHPPPGHAVCYH